MLIETLLLLTVFVNGNLAASDNPKKFVKMRRGDGGTCSIVILAAQGGGMLGDPNFDFDDRLPGCELDGTCQYGYNITCTSDDPVCPIVTERAEYTIALGYELVEVLTEELGCKPYLIYNRLHRQKIDLDAVRKEGVQLDLDTEIVFDKFQDKVDKVKATFDRRGLLIDLTGQSAESETHFRYHMTKDVLLFLNEGFITGDQTTWRFTSMYGMYEDGVTPGDALKELFFGTGSLGGLLEAGENGYTAFPAPTLPADVDTSSYMYDTVHYQILRKHSSRNKKVDSITDGVQVAVPAQVRVSCPGDERGSDATGREDCERIKYGKDLGKAIAGFYTSHYGAP